jgi:hypothetical protein
MLKKFLYLVYYLKQLDKAKFTLYVNYTAKVTGKSKATLVIDAFLSVFKFNISPLEYFQFRFFEKLHQEKLKWAGTGYMYEYQKVMNPPTKRNILDDKREFYKFYKEFFVNHVFSLQELIENDANIDDLYKSKKLVFKVSDGKCGVSVNIVKSSQIVKSEIVSFMKSHGYDMVETFIQQHDDLNRLSPSAVNTVRIFTQLNDKNEVEILGCRQRISIDCPVDNMAAGNIAAPINESTGIIDGPGVYSDITKIPEYFHPITGVSIVGFQVPFWKECLQLAKDAALKHPQNRSIGWDIVVTANGPGLIEGNHDWCKLVWQLPVYKGLKFILENHLNVYKALN